MGIFEDFNVRLENLEKRVESLEGFKPLAPIRDTSGISPEVSRVTTLSMYVASLINSVIISRSMERQQLAEKMGWQPSTVTKLLSGTQNLTLATIAKVETVLGIEIIPTSLPGGGI